MIHVYDTLTAVSIPYFGVEFLNVIAISKFGNSNLLKTDICSSFLIGRSEEIPIWRSTGVFQRVVPSRKEFCGG